MSNYVVSKKKPEIRDKGFIVGDRFISVKSKSSSNWVCPRFITNIKEDDNWKISCGSEYSAGYSCNLVFNGDFNLKQDTGWSGSSGYSNDWLLVQNKVKPINVRKLYFLAGYDSGTNGFDSFKFYGSEDNENYDLLFESNSPVRTNDGNVYYEINNSKSYFYHKFTFYTSFIHIYIAQIAMFSNIKSDISFPYDYK